MKKIITAIAVFVWIATGLFSKSIWVDRNVYSTGDSLKPGDIIIVNVNDISNMRFDLTLGNTGSSTLASNPDVTITGFLPKVSSNRNFNNTDSTKFSEKGQLTVSVASTVNRRIAGNKYLVSGARTYVFNGITNIISVRGIVDPVLVKGRMVDSKNIANLVLEIKGSKKGIDISGKKAAEGESVKAELTEDEKQKIIADYLKKMLGEITR